MSRVWQWLRQLTKWWFIILGMIATGFLIMIVMAVSSLRTVTTASLPTSPSSTVAAEAVPDKALLHLKLRGNLRASRPDTDDVWAGFMGLQERQMFLDDIRKGLRKAAKDERIKGILVSVGPIMASTTTYSDLRRMLVAYKDTAGKPVKIHVTQLTTRELLLASAGDELVIPPLADIHLPGPQFQLTYFGDALDRLGVQFEVVKAGRFKSAMEPMTADTPSTASIEMYEAMVSASGDYYAQTIATGRKATPAKVKEWFDESVFSPQQAVDAGIADRLAYGEDMVDAYAKALKAEAYGFMAYARADMLTALAGGGSASPVALIEATGEITSSAADSSEGITPRKLIRRLNWAFEEDDIKAVVLRVNSPGGSANASDIIWQEVAKLDAKKPVVVQMTDVAASGGYYIAAGARKIVADPLTITGSIGVIYAFPYGPKFKDKYGISFYGIGNDRTPRTFADPLTDYHKKRLESSITYTYEQFLDRVAEGRGKAADEIAPLAEGRVYTGAEALKLGLVDTLGGLDAAVEVASKLAGITEDPWPLRTYSRKSPFAQAMEMMSSLQRGISKAAGRAAWQAGPFAVIPDAAVRDVSHWKHWASQRVALSYWPYRGQLR